jgi:hypothetical protein
MYHIVWKMKDRDYSGNGDYCLSLDQAKDYVVSLNKEYPELNHWYEAMPVPVATPRPVVPLMVNTSASGTPEISPNSRPLSLNLKGHRCSYGDMTFIAARSPENSPPSC